MPAEFLQREVRTVKQFKADEDNQCKNRQRHGQRQPFEGVVAEVPWNSFPVCRYLCHSILQCHLSGAKPKGRRAGGTALFVLLTPVKYRAAARSHYLIVSSSFNARCCTSTGN